MIRNIYYTPILVLSLIVMLFLLIRLPHEHVKHLQLLPFICIPLGIGFYFINERYKNLAHLIVIWLFIGLMLILRH
jgi:uncharacterized membrane protein YccC